MTCEKILKRYYLHGCTQLVKDIRELMYQAAEYEKKNFTPQDWLIDNGFKSIKNKPDQHLTWGAAANILLSSIIINIETNKKQEGTGDYPKGPDGNYDPYGEF